MPLTLISCRKPAPTLSLRGIMISNVIVSLFGAAYDWPLGAAISAPLLMLVLALLFLVERLEKKLSFS